MKSEIRNNELKGMNNMVYSTKAEIHGPKFIGMAGRQEDSPVKIYVVEKCILF